MIGNNTNHLNKIKNDIPQTIFLNGVVALFNRHCGEYGKLSAFCENAWANQLRPNNTERYQQIISLLKLMLGSIPNSCFVGAGLLPHRTLVKFLLSDLIRLVNSSQHCVVAKW